MGKRALIVSVLLIFLIIADFYFVSFLGRKWQPDEEHVADFAASLAHSIDDFSKLKISTIPCDVVGETLWYSAKMCAEYLITPRNCEQPSATIRYIGPEPTLLRMFVTAREYYIRGARIIAVVSSRGQICSVYGENRNEN